ncbi:MAG: MFS transporter [Microbacteriaceae bacterium]|nr:MFS transporter [Microbacteriaceae bacterium]
MTQTRPLPLWAGRSMLLVGIVLVALNLRTAVAAVSPIAAEISVDIPLSESSLGIIGTLPPVFFALSAIFGARLSHRFGLEWSVVIAGILMAVGHTLRALAPSYALLFLGSVIVFSGIGLANVLLPPLVKRYFPDRIGLVTALYVSILAVGTALPAALAAPVAGSVGWRVSLGIWVVLAVAGILPWLSVLLGQRRARLARARSAQDGDDLPETPTDQALQGPIWRSRTAWVVACCLALTAFHVYSLFAWLPQMLITLARLSPGQAGTLLAWYGLIALPSALVVPALAIRIRNVGLLIYLGMAFFVVGYLGLLFAPRAAPFLWVSLAGLGPIIFTTSLVLINLRTRTPRGSVALSGFVQAVGYTLGATGPLLLGFLHELTGGWTLALWVLIGTAIIGLIPAMLLRHPSFVEDELAACRTRQRKKPAA